MVLWELEGSSRKTSWNKWKTLGLRWMKGNGKPSERDRQKELKEEEQEEEERGEAKKEEGENDLCSFRSKKKYNVGSDYFLDWFFFCFELLKHVPGIAFTSAPFSSYMSERRRLGNRIIRVDLDIKRGSCWALSMEKRLEASFLITDLRACNSYYFPTRILVALLVSGML